MSFSLSNAAPLGNPPLDYAAFVAGVRNRGRAAGPSADPWPDGLHPHLYLAEVILSRPDWRAAARHLGGRFVPAQA